MKTRYITTNDIKTVITETFTTALHLLTSNGTQEEINALHADFDMVFNLVTSYTDYVRNTLERDEHTGVSVIKYTSEEPEPSTITYQDDTRTVFDVNIPYCMSRRSCIERTSNRPLSWYMTSKTIPFSPYTEMQMYVKHGSDYVDMMVNSNMTYYDIVQGTAERLGLNPTISDILVNGEIMDRNGFIHIDKFFNYGPLQIVEQP